MGGKYSTELPSATEFQKDRLGVFSLRGKQKQSLVVLEELLKELLENKSNKIFSLIQTIQSAETQESACESLFLVLSSSLKKEFQLLKFPDPTRPSDVSDVAYIPISTYKESIAKDEKRKILCDNIAWFMVRLITVLMALISSVNFDYRKDILPVRTNSTILVPPRLGTNKPISSLILNQLTTVPIDEKQPNLRFIGNKDIIIAVDTGIVFYKSSIAIQVAAISIEPYEPVLQRQYPSPGSQYPLMGAQYPLMGAQYQQTGQYPPTGPMGSIPQDPRKMFKVTLYPCLYKKGICVGEKLEINTVAKSPILNEISNESNESSVVSNGQFSSATRTTQVQEGGKRKTRKMKTHNRRKTYRYYAKGGNDNISTLTFILRDDGMTRSMDEQSFTQTFSDRVKSFLSMIPTEEQYKPAENPFIPLNNITKEVISRIVRIHDELKPKGESRSQKLDNVHSPAQLRAFLLASQSQTVNDLQLLTSFCEDIWRGKNVSKILAYGLLDALFRDVRADKGSKTISTSSQLEYNTILEQFTSKNIMVPVPELVEKFSSFHDLMFAPLPEELGTFCDQSVKTIDNKIYIELLTNAHKKIRDLYDAHLQNVVSLITSKIISPRSRGYTKVEWSLNTEFATDSRGALILLESIIKEARVMLAKHYFAVESVYTSTINSMKTIGLGVAPPKNILLAQ
jgi:hypothetical protein